MKRKLSLLLIMPLVLALNACGGNVEEVPQSSFPTENFSVTELLDFPEESEKTDINSENKTLIAYFSWADNAVMDDVDAMTSANVKSPGNVAQLAKWIESETGGDLFPIKVTDLYLADWDGCLERANNEKAEGTYPSLAETVENISEYDTVFLGYPNWWYSCPMAVLSFIEQNDLSDKNIYLFCSHGTGGLSGSVQDITAALPETAVVSDNVFHVFQDDTDAAKEDLRKWLNSIQ
ncbi:MAG: NAD(P)H-dependent oxidoreductase [Eubacterium sp.]|nr:NAD(P)H-dependent oxidoreductase [Eubacterium sp.]